MSGRKYSLVELANNVREAIRCRLSAEQVCARAESLVSSFAEAAGSAHSLREAASSAQGTLAELRSQLESLAERFDESNLMKLSPAQVTRERRNVERLKSELDQIAARCRAGNEAAALRAELAAVLNGLQRDRETMEPWLRDIYGPFTEETRRVLEQLDRQIRADGSMGELAGEIRRQIAQYEAMMDRAAERRSLDGERRYVADALEKVCREMAFATERKPQAGPLEDLVLKVDTFAYGIIEFRLQLDGAIRSQSEMIEASCCANFAMIEEKLRGFGVLSSFRYEGDQRPVRLRKGEESLPDSEPGATRQEGL